MNSKNSVPQPPERGGDGKTMRTDLQRRAIAKACGWINQGEIKGVPALEHRWKAPHEKFVGDSIPPDYLNDLNAMHEAEKLIVNGESEQRSRWFIWMQVNGDVAGIHATAAQRAEAFLKTIGKWSDK